MKNKIKKLTGFALQKVKDPVKFIEFQKEMFKRALKKNPNHQGDAGKIAHIKHPNLSRENGIKGSITNRKNKTGFFDPKIQSIGGKIGWKKAAETNRKNGTGVFDKKIQSMGGKLGAEVCRRKGLGIFDPKVRNKIKGMGTLACKEKKVGFYDPERKIQKMGSKKSLEIQKENGTGLYKKDKELCSRAGKIGGPKSVESNRLNSPYIWEGVGFLSRQEMKVAQIILTKPILGINCHIKVDSKTIDFFPQENDKMFQGKLIEYHPWDRKLTTEEYYNKRRKLLDENGFNDKELIVIDSNKFIKENGELL